MPKQQEGSGIESVSFNINCKEIDLLKKTVTNPFIEPSIKGSSITDPLI